MKRAKIVITLKWLFCGYLNKCFSVLRDKLHFPLLVGYTKMIERIYYFVCNCTQNLNSNRSESAGSVYDLCIFTPEARIKKKNENSKRFNGHPTSDGHEYDLYLFASKE